MNPEARWIATSGEAGAFRLDLEEALGVLSRKQYPDGVDPWWAYVPVLSE